MKAINRLFSTMFLIVAIYTMMDAAHAGAQPADLQAAISSMKDAPRGPFQRLRWFCHDGAVLPPKPYACSDRGGGVQHGEYTETTRQIRAAGYPIATLLADTTPADILDTENGDDLLKAMLIEQFLIGFDDGWIFRKAQFYRGAVQHEDEQRSGQALLEALAGNDEWLRDRFVVVREAVRLLAHNRTLISLSDVRGKAAAIADKDKNFRGLRGKIHGRPDAGDAQRVRDYARLQGQPQLRAEYENLASLIDQTYRGSDLGAVLAAAAGETSVAGLRDLLRGLARQSLNTPVQQLAAATLAMRAIRQQLPMEKSAQARVGLLDSTIELERIAFITCRGWQAGQRELASRQEMLAHLQHNADGLYGAGLITPPEHNEITLSLTQLDSDELTLEHYRQELQHLGMVSEWANRQLMFHFQEAVNLFTRLEPLADQFIADRLRSSPLLAYEAIHAALALDAQATGNVRHELFGAPVAAGVRSLNPGLARGVLYEADHDTPLSAYESHGIYIVPETLPRLPPVAGILTRSEGNALSHVQLLARNLGIPNIVVSDEVLDRLKANTGKRIVIAASAGGVVRIATDSFEWDNVFRADREAERAPLHIDVDKLDLATRELYPLSRLRATDSGRIAGPKAAKLGELMQQFPGHVAPGLVLPFGVYRDLLNQPLNPRSDLSMMRWIEQQYASLDELRDRDTVAYATELQQTLDFIRDWILRTPLPQGLEARLRAAMTDQFGREGSYGVFVRSDTNVEDLPNFSGAGLNLTVPNVVGFDATVAAIRRVWASPFTERAFSWRQSLMDKPEHVYASVLLQVGVPAEKSGVLLTQDVTSGARDVATVVVNEGVGGGVNGQLAETLKLGIADDSVRRISTATAIQRTVLRASGGVDHEAVSASASVLNDQEIRALRELTRRIPQRMPEFAARGTREPPAADVEFGFHNGHLWLFQVRPFVESGSANRNRYLNALDAGLRRSADKTIDLDRAPVTVGS